jgi:hypothetical protein
MSNVAVMKNLVPLNWFLAKKQITSDVQYMFVLNPSSRPLSMNEPTFWAIASGIFWVKLNKTK